MDVKIGKYTVSYEKAQALIDIGKKIDSDKEKLSKQEEVEIEKALNECKGDISCAETMLRKIILTSYFPEMISIPAGKFPMGSIDGGSKEQPAGQVKISAFKMGKYEVTYEEYKAYLEATCQEIPEHVDYEELGRHPVVDVTWNDAVEYCEWLSKETGREFRLPTDAEWEYAARGTDGRKYPWGNEFALSNAAFNLDGSVSVGSYPKDMSPFGAMDMTGNVAEWVGDWFADKYNPKDLINPKGLKISDYRVLRGGSWCESDPGGLRGADRYLFCPEFRDYCVGFRVAEDISTNK